jgi:hypothetical protein
MAGSVGCAARIFELQRLVGTLLGRSARKPVPNLSRSTFIRQTSGFVDDTIHDIAESSMATSHGPPGHSLSGPQTVDFVYTLLFHINTFV